MPSDEQKRHWAKEYGTLHGSLVTNKNRDELAYVAGGVTKTGTLMDFSGLAP